MAMPVPSAPLLLAAIVLWQAGAARAPLVSVSVSPEAPAIGEPIRIELRVRAAPGTEIGFPALPDSAEAIEPLDPRAVRDASTAELLDRTAVYRMIAWDTGSHALRFDDVTLNRAGVETRYRVRLPPIRVRSVLPADSAGRVPRPARGPIAVPGGWWRLWLGLAVVALLAWLGWRIWKTRDRNHEPPTEDAARRADRAFTHLASLGLLEAGEYGRYVLAHVAILREYLAARFPQADLSRTAREVADALVQVEFPVLPERVVELLLRAEPIAFARAPVDEHDARELAQEAQGIMRDVETALRSRQASGGRARARR
ncbi:MAG TPA: hypothetical protein VFM71_12180 [Gemmatimonadaceae bacterium]|nr:hypothetical protein [Gemmatimonadaceae bacterium]